MNKIIISNTQGKEILNTLLAFKHKGTYECAEKLIEHSKSDLEISKADIESYIDSRRTGAAILAVLGLLLPIVANTSIIQCIADLLGSNYVIFVELIKSLVALFLLISTIQVFLDVDKTVSLLHIVKIAIAQKMETSVSEQRLKELFKVAIVEELEERSDLLGDIVEQVFEDVALVHAIKEGENTEEVDRDQVFKLF